MISWGPGAGAAAAGRSVAKTGATPGPNAIVSQASAWIAVIATARKKKKKKKKRGGGSS